MPPPEAPAVLPSNPSLNLLGSLAKQLRKAHRARDPSALQRIRAHHPAHADTSPDALGDVRFSLRDAQLVVAREHGFENWARLKRHVESTRAASSGSWDGTTTHLRRVIPFFAVADIHASLAHYVDRLGFEQTNQWHDDGRLAWVQLERGACTLMLQQFRTEGVNARVFEGRRGTGAAFAFLSAGEESNWPHAGRLQPTVDPDGYTLLSAPDTFALGSFRRVLPVLDVVNVDASLQFYVDRLGFRERDRWSRAGETSRCRLVRDDVTLILDALPPERRQADERRGQGVTLNIVCDDALAFHGEIGSRGVSTREPYVGNWLWNVIFSDPDGYRIDVYSPTDEPEGTVLSTRSAGKAGGSHA